MQHEPSRIKAVPVAAWCRLPRWSRERDAELTAWYVSTVAPRLRSIRPSDIRRMLGCGGGSRVPHPRLIRHTWREWRGLLIPSAFRDPRAGLIATRTASAKIAGL
jgi:hypothetical protein